MYIRIDPQVKADVEAIYARYGMSITDAVNVFLYTSKNIGGLPFDLRPTVQEGNARIQRQQSAYGCLQKYANPSLIPKESGVWEQAVAEKYADR